MKAKLVIFFPKLTMKVFFHLRSSQMKAQIELIASELDHFIQAIHNSNVSVIHSNI